MKDFRQLVRWALPGFICLTFAIVFYVIPDPDQGKRLFDLLRGSNSGTAVNIIGGIVGVFAVVTALGFLLSTLHHLLLNSIYPAWLNADLREAIRVSGLEVRDYKDRLIEPSHLTVPGAWIVVNVAWHANKGPADSRVAAAEWRSQSMYDLMHGAGATFVGVVAAIVFGIIMGGVDGFSLKLEALVLLVAIANFRLVAKRTEAVTGGLVVAVLPRSGPKIMVDERFACARKRKKELSRIATPQSNAAEQRSTPASAPPNPPPP